MAYAIVFGFFAVIVGALTAFDAKLFSGKELRNRFFTWFAIFGVIAVAIGLCIYYDTPVTLLISP